MKACGVESADPALVEAGPQPESSAMAASAAVTNRMTLYMVPLGDEAESKTQNLHASRALSTEDAGLMSER